MRFRDPLRLNDWGIVPFLGVVLGIQLLLWLTLVLEENGAGIPLLRQVVGFVYLTWVPGIILLRILRVHKVGAIETLLFSVGLSVSTVLFLGFATNTIYPMLDLLKPISEAPLLITMTVFVFAGAVIAYIVDRDFNQPEYITTEETFGWPVFLFALLPFLAIFGAWLVNNYRINTLLFVLLAVIAIVPALVAFRRIVPERYYPFVIWTVGLALLLHASLISNHIWGWDINQEYYISNLVVQNGAWDFSIYSNINAMLSIVMLAPIYSILCSIDIVWVFKIIYPLLFSLAPLGIYMIARRQSYDRIAFYGTFFFITFFVFFTEMLQVARQEIAELFLVLIALLIINKDLDKIKKYILLIVFSFSLAVSHYGVSYLFMVMITLAWVILVVSEPRLAQQDPGPVFPALRLGEARIRPELQAAPRGGAGDHARLRPALLHLRAGLVHVHLLLLGPELDHRARPPVLEQHGLGLPGPRDDAGALDHRERIDDTAPPARQVRPARRPVLHLLRDPLASPQAPEDGPRRRVLRARPRVPFRSRSSTSPSRPQACSCRSSQAR